MKDKKVTVRELFEMERRGILADRVIEAVKWTVIVLGLAGSVWGIVRCRQLREEGKALDAAIEWLDAGNRIKAQAIRARADRDHPARGLVAIAEVMYDAINEEIGGAL